MKAAEPLDLKIRTLDRARFTSPGAVVESRVLSTEEKRDILRRWLDDEKALLVADDEGMLGGQVSHFDLVHRALQTLRK